MDEFDYLEFDSFKPHAQPAQDRLEDSSTPAGRGRQCRRRGDFYEAAKWFESAVNANDHDFASRVLQVDSLVRAGVLDEANRTSDVNLNRFKRVRDHYASRALVLGRMGQFGEALRHCAVALDGEKRSAYAHCVRGEMALLQDPGGYEEAMRWFEQALDISGDRWEAHAVAGTALLDADLPTLAAAFFAEAGHCDPMAAYSWLGLGDCFAKLRLYDQALFYYRRVLQVIPDHAGALAREKKYAGRVYDLLRALHRPNLIKRWNEAYDKLLKRR